MMRVTGNAKHEEPCGSADGLVQLRPVGRHETVARLLGPKTINRRWATTPGWAKQEMIGYARRRTILELALASAKARGLMSLVPLVIDRPARYYEDYRRLTNDDGEGWSELCYAAGLTEGEDNPDVLLNHKDLRTGEIAGNGDSGSLSERERERPETQVLHPVDPAKLADHVLASVANTVRGDADYEDLRQDLIDTLKELQKDSDVELHIRDDRVCSKAFRDPATLPTATSVEAYKRLIVNRVKAGDTVYVSSEAGDWMLREPFKEKLLRADTIKLLLAFDTNRKILEKTYGEKLEATTVDPWRHNRHMTIVCKGAMPERAIYFARRLRSPVITAVYLDNIGDVLLLRKLYEQRWEESHTEEEAARKAQAAVEDRGEGYVSAS